MRKYGKWVLTLSLLAATPGLTVAAGSKSKADTKPAIGAKAPRTDNQRVAEEIASALKGRVQGENISIEYKDGTAVLMGSVLDPKSKDKATALVKQVSSVVKVDNRMTVVEKKRAFTERLVDRGAANDIVQANHASENPKHRRVQQVNAEIREEAMVTPSGGQSSGAASANQEIAEQIGAALSAAQFDGYQIDISFQDGVAMLAGNVGTPTERANAARVCSSIPEVRSVDNRLRCTEMPRQAANYAAAPNGPYGQQRGNVRGASHMQQPPAQAFQGQGNPGQGYPGQGYPGQMAPGGQMPGGQMGGMPMGPGAPPYPPSYGQGGNGASQATYNSPNMPDHAWPSYAQYPNSAAVSYPQQYSASAWPYIGPFYPYPQVPLGWRDATLRWDDGQWNLMFKPRTDRWWWFVNPNNW